MLILLVIPALLCDNLIELLERDCKKEENSIKIFHAKWYLNNYSSGFLNAAQSLQREMKSQASRNSENDWKGRNQYNQYRKKKNNDSKILIIDKFAIIHRGWIKKQFLLCKKLFRKAFNTENYFYIHPLTMTVVRKVEVTLNITHINCQ